MGRLTEYFGWRDIEPENLTKLWTDHNMKHIDTGRSENKRLRKAHLKSTLKDRQDKRKGRKEKQLGIFD